MTAADARRRFNLPVIPACVLVDGPQDNEGSPEWTVCFGDDAGEVIDVKAVIWFCASCERAQEYGVELARRYGLEYVNEASPA